MEQKLDIVQNGDFKNIFFFSYIKNGAKGLDDGNFIVVEKVFADGREIDMKTYMIYSCKVKYLEEEVTFVLNAREHEEYKNLGGIGDKIKITLKKEPYINKKGVEILAKNLYFELA